MSGSVDTQVSLLHFCKTSVASFPFESFLTSLLFLPTGVPLKSDCLGNVMRVSLDRALEMGNGLEVEAVSEYRIRQQPRGGAQPLAEAVLEHGFSSFPPHQMAPNTICCTPIWLRSVVTAWSRTPGGTRGSTRHSWPATWTAKYCIQ